MGYLSLKERKVSLWVDLYKHDGCQSTRRTAELMHVVLLIACERGSGAKCGIWSKIVAGGGRNLIVCSYLEQHAMMFCPRKSDSKCLTKLVSVVDFSLSTIPV